MSIEREFCVHMHGCVRGTIEEVIILSSVQTFCAGKGRVSACYIIVVWFIGEHRISSKFFL